jgi:GT2 family glycosyltransferase/glycosyltransferase involved in cell wall biosynthesis
VAAEQIFEVMMAMDSTPSAVTRTAPLAVTDIVIPIYNAPDDLRKCIESVFAHTDVSHYRLTLIDDGSPDVRIGQYLEELGKTAPQVYVLRNEKNLGFTATVNRAFRETTQDVLLLNSDTVVTPHWLPSMRACLESDPKIATVTPFSNNAEIASVPIWLQDNPAPSPDEAAHIAQAARDISDGSWPDLPTGVGFCMLLSRAAIHTIGEFDEATFGRGYGEENDWCQRALKAGWRNVLCTSAYVMHTGSQSFSDAKKALVATNIGKLNRKHPGYDVDVQRFIARDPIAPYRNALNSRAIALRDREKPGVLHILHGKDGGLERHARDLVRDQAGVRHYILLALGETWTIEDHADTHSPLTFEIEHQRDELWKDFFEGVCERFAIDAIHIHHISACRDGLLLALKDTKIPYRVTLHDFYYACPAVHLLKGDDTYCGAQTDVRVCQACIDSHPLVPRKSVEEWRAQNEALLAKATHVIAPSDFTARTTNAYFKNIAITTIPHVTRLPTPSEIPAAQFSPPPNKFSVTLAVVGAVGPLKGARNVELIGRRLRERKLDARLVLIGYLDRQFHASAREGGQFIVHGAYKTFELPHLLKAYDTSIVIFPAIGPETYGYALSEVWLSGFVPVVSDVGTLPARVRNCDGGWVVPLLSDKSIDDWIDNAIAMGSTKTAKERNEKIAHGQQSVAADELRVHTIAVAKVDASNDQIPPLRPARWLGSGHMRSLENSTPTRRYSSISEFTRTSAKFLLRRCVGVRHTRFGRFLERQVGSSVKRKLRSFLTS